MSREGKLVKNTMILAIGTFFPKLAIFIALPILTAYLSKEDYGVYDLVFSMVSLVLPAATLQIQSAAFRFLIDVKDKEDEKQSIITNICAFTAVASLIALVVIYFILWQLKQPLPIRLAICFYYFIDIIVNVSRQIVRGLSRNIDYAISAIISGAGQILFIVLLVMALRTGLLGGLIALATAEVLSTAYLLYRGRILKYINPSRINGAKIREMLGYSWPMVPNSLSQWVIHAADRLIITSHMGLAANAVYSVAYKIPSILSLAQTTFNMAWQENASISANDNDVAAYYSSMFKWLFNIVSGIMSMLIGFTPILFWMFVRGDYAEAYNQIPILFMGMYFLCLSTFWGGIFVAKKQTKIVGTTTVIAAAISLTFNIVMIRFIGLYASSIASVVAYSSMCAMRIAGVHKIMKIHYDFKHIGLVIALLAVQCVVCFMQNLPLNVVNLLLGCAVCLALNYKLLKAMIAKVLGKAGKKAA